MKYTLMHKGMANRAALNEWWIEFDDLRGLEKEVVSVFEGADKYIHQTRRDAIVLSMKKRIENLEIHAMSKHSVSDNREEDVEEDIAQDYFFIINSKHKIIQEER